MAQAARAMEDVREFHGLRGLMAWWVVIGHITATLGWTTRRALENTLAVDVFVLLSGFVIFVLLDRKQEPYIPYIIRRALRLFPLYLVVLALSVALLPLTRWAFAHAPFFSTANMRRVQLVDLALSSLPLHLAAHIPLAQGLIPERLLPSVAFTLVGQAWSISLEWQYYLVAPMFFAAARSGRGLVAAAAIVTLVVLSRGPFTSAFLGAKALLFAAGALTYLVMRPSTSRRLRAMAFLAIGGAALADVLIFGRVQIVPLTIWLITCISTVLRPLSVISGILKSSFLSWHGDRSFSI